MITIQNWQLTKSVSTQHLKTPKRLFAGFFLGPKFGISRCPSRPHNDMYVTKNRSQIKCLPLKIKFRWLQLKGYIKSAKKCVVVLISAEHSLPGLIEASSLTQSREAMDSSREKTFVGRDKIGDQITDEELSLETKKRVQRKIYPRSRVLWSICARI